MERYSPGVQGDDVADDLQRAGDSRVRRPGLLIEAHWIETTEVIMLYSITQGNLLTNHSIAPTVVIHKMALSAA